VQSRVVVGAHAQPILDDEQFLWRFAQHSRVSLALELRADLAHRHAGGDFDREAHHEPGRAAGRQFLAQVGSDAGCAVASHGAPAAAAVQGGRARKQ